MKFTISKPISHTADGRMYRIRIRRVITRCQSLGYAMFNLHQWAQPQQSRFGNLDPF